VQQFHWDTNGRFSDLLVLICTIRPLHLAPDLACKLSLAPSPWVYERYK
jgi:hypothetical protein